MRSSRALTIDDGAAQALLHGGSLLPVGVKKVEGSFERGDAVRVIALSGKEVAVGLVTYSARDLERLCGHHSNEIEAVLGYTFGDEVIHRNNLMLL
jgi:glutamate 5-kinase